MTRPTRYEAARSSALLSVLFLGVYGGCNWITAQRSDVGIWFYEWEKFIPFVPLMIVPYMSIDLFYVAAPFLCETKAELKLFARRIVLCILIAGACFLLLPLQLAFPRPETPGWTGAIFRFLHGFDQPHNLFPSLHIALRTILAELYGRHTRGWVRATSHVWFSLIGLSTLLTYQHHVVDVLGGFALALVCFYVVRDQSLRKPVVRNHFAGLVYAAAALSCLAGGFLLSAWFLLLLWPALSLGLTAIGYWGLGPGIYRKENGRIPLSARILFAPNLFGQQLSLLHYRRQCLPWNEITPRVWIGAKLTSREASAARRLGVTSVLDLTVEFSEATPFLKSKYFNLQVLDLTAPTQHQLHQAADFIEQHSRTGIIYVHCKVGYSRSTAAVGAYLLKSGKTASVFETLQRIREARPGVIIRPEIVKSLSEFAESLASSPMMQQRQQ